MHAIQVDALRGRRPHRGLRIGRRHADQERRAFLRDVGPHLAHRLPGDQRHFAHIAQARQLGGAQVRQHHVGVLALAFGRGVQDGQARLQRYAAGRHHLAHAQVRVRLVRRAACRRALGIGQNQVQVLRAQLRHARHATRFHVQRVASGQAQLQMLRGVVLIDAIGVPRAAHDVLIRHQADLAGAFQRARIGADDGTALGADRDGDAVLGVDIAQADAALGRIQADGGVAVGGHHAVHGLHRQRTRELQRQVARVAHVAHQHAAGKRLRAGAVLRHVRHVDGFPDRVQEAAANIHHLHAIGARGGHIGLPLADIGRRRAFQQLAVVDEDVAAVLVQAEAVGEQELHGTIGRQGRAQLQRCVVGEHRLKALPQARVAEVDAGTVQRRSASRADVAIQRVIHARQVDRVGARQNGLVGLGQRVKYVGAFVVRQAAQAGQLQGVVAQLGANGTLARRAQHDAAARLHVQEAVCGRRAVRITVHVEHLFVDGRRHRIQQVVLDVAQRGRREIEEVARVVGLAVQRNISRRLRRRIRTHGIGARVGFYTRPVQAGCVKRQRDGLAHVGIQRQQAVVLPRARLVQHGVGQRRRQADRAVRAHDGVVRRVGPHIAHGLAEIDLVAGTQRTQLPRPIVHDVHVGQLEAARPHCRQARAHRSRGGLQAVAPVVVVFGRLRQFLIDHVVVDDLVARGLDQILRRRDIQRGRQVVGVKALVLQLFVQRLHLRGQACRRTGGLRLEQVGRHGKHAVHVGRSKAAQQLARDAGVGKERLDQFAALGRLVQQFNLLMQHRLFLGRKQLNRVVRTHQHVIRNVRLQAGRFADLHAHVVQVDTVVVLQGAVARHLAIGIRDRHDIHVGQRDDVVGRHGSAAGGRVQQLHRHRARRAARHAEDLRYRHRRAVIEGAIDAAGQRHDTAVHTLDVIDGGLRGVRKTQLHALALHQAVGARQGQRGGAKLRQRLLRKAVVHQADAGVHRHAVQIGRVAARRRGVVNVGVLVDVQVFQLRLLRIHLARERDAAGQPRAVGAGRRQRIAVGVHDGQDVQRAVVVDAQVMALQLAILVGHVQLKPGQRDRLPALQQRLDAVGQLRARNIAQVGVGQIPAEAVAHVDEVGIPGARRFRIGVERQQVCAEPAPVVVRGIRRQHALLQRRSAKAALDRVGDGHGAGALAQARQAVDQLRRQRR